MLRRRIDSASVFQLGRGPHLITKVPGIYGALIPVETTAVSFASRTSGMSPTIARQVLDLQSADLILPQNGKDLVVGVFLASISSSIMLTNDLARETHSYSRLLLVSRSPLERRVMQQPLDRRRPTDLHPRISQNCHSGPATGPPCPRKSLRASRAQARGAGRCAGRGRGSRGCASTVRLRVPRR